MEPTSSFIHSGQHETQVSEGGEADLYKHFDECKKKQGHKNFIPVKKFSMKDLPKGYHDIDLYEFIKATSYITVRVTVKMTSPDRPKIHPGTRFPYPFCDIKNKTALRTGTGEIFVYKFIDGRIEGGAKLSSKHFYKSTTTCPCTKCLYSDKPNNVWWVITVNTATHVVFDDKEASQTSCRLFYDEQDSPKVILDDLSIDFVNIMTDRCILKYVTCDSLGEELYIMQDHRADLWGKVLSKHGNKSDDDLTFIVSHPHGCHKHVSVGQLIDNGYIQEHDKSFDNTLLKYTTCTCPGSSGARVHCVRSFNIHVHWGALCNGLNYSCVGLFMVGSLHEWYKQMLSN